MIIATNIILIWSGTHASIPSGYSRETSLDAKFLKGNPVSTNPNVSGGSNTHTHTSSAHVHAMTNHVHTVTITGITGNEGSKADDVRNSATDHTDHGVAINSGAVTGGALSSEAGTYASVNQEPPYYEVIFIKSGGSRGIPDSVVGLFDSATLPTNWKFCDGNNSTPDFRNKYLKGAGTGADSGTTGGSTNHSHVLSHTHTVADHGHAAVTSGSANRFSQKSVAGSGYVNHSHTHSITLDNASASLDAGNPTLTTTETVEPAYKKLLAIQNQNGQDSAPKGIIGLWLGALSAIPVGWEEYTAMNDRYLKIANDTSEIGNTGGSNSHVHSNNTHTHTVTGTHSHTASGMGHVTSINRTGSTNSATPASAVHTYTVSSTSIAFDSSTTNADSSSNEPAHLTTSFIKLANPAEGGFLLNFV